MRYVSTTVLMMEAVMTKRMDNLLVAQHTVAQGAFDQAMKLSVGRGITLSAEQTAASKYVLFQSGCLAVWEGHAGSGKTTSLRVVADAYRLDGYKVIGCSKAALAAGKLQEETGIESSTIDALVRDIDNGKVRLTKRSVIFLDEAGMADTTSAARIVQHVEAAGAKIILAGDRQQIQPIGQGGAFTYAAEKTVFNLTENHRQKKEQDRLDALTFRKGTMTEIKAVLDRWKGEGRLSVQSTLSKAAVMAAEDFVTAKDSEGNPLPYDKKILMAERRETVALMNDTIQKFRSRRGEVGDTYTLQVAPTESNDKKPQPVYETVRMAVGDRIAFCKNSTPKMGIVDPETGRKSSVKNGEKGVITDMRRDGEAWLMEARLDDGRKVAFRTDKYDRINLGYGATIHKSQGQSVDQAFAVTERPDRHSQYVTQTRHRIHSKTYTTEAAEASLARASSRENKAVLASELVAAYRAKIDAQVAQRVEAIEAQRRAQEAKAAQEAEERGRKAQEAKKPVAEQAKAKRQQKGQELGFGM